MGPIIRTWMKLPTLLFLILLPFIFPPLIIYFGSTLDRGRRGDLQYNVSWTFLLWFPVVIHAMLYATGLWNYVNGREILCFASPKTVEVFSQKEYDESNCSCCAHCSRKRKALTPTSLPWTHLHNFMHSLFTSSGKYSTPVSIPPVFPSTLGSLV